VGEALRRGADEVWLAWCVADSPYWGDGPLEQYVHMTEMSANGALFAVLAAVRRPFVLHANRGSTRFQPSWCTARERSPMRSQNRRSSATGVRRCQGAPEWTNGQECESWVSWVRQNASGSSGRWPPSPDGG